MLSLLKRFLTRRRQRRHLRRLHRQLVDDHGRKRFYRPHQVKSRFQFGGYSAHFQLWLAYAVFCHRSEFDRVCTEEQYTADYHELRSPFLATGSIVASADTWDGFGADFGGGGDGYGFDGCGGDGGGGD